jgi:hypothetical protein
MRRSLVLTPALIPFLAAAAVGAQEPVTYGGEFQKTLGNEFGGVAVNASARLSYSENVASSEGDLGAVIQLLRVPIEAARCQFRSRVTPQNGETRFLLRIRGITVVDRTSGDSFDTPVYHYGAVLLNLIARFRLAGVIPVYLLAQAYAEILAAGRLTLEPGSGAGATAYAESACIGAAVAIVGGQVVSARLDAQFRFFHNALVAEGVATFVGANGRATYYLNPIALTLRLTIQVFLDPILIRVRRTLVNDNFGGVVQELFNVGVSTAAAAPDFLETASAEDPEEPDENSDLLEHEDTTENQPPSPTDPEEPPLID